MNEFEEFFRRPSSTWAQRTAPSQSPNREGVQNASDDYKPYGFTPSDDLETCDVAWWLRDTLRQGQTFQYRYLVRIGYFGDDELHLMLTDCVLQVVGRQLSDLRNKLARRKVTFIQAYHPAIWPVRPEPNAPIIERVGLLYPGEISQQLGRAQ